MGSREFPSTDPYPKPYPVRPLLVDMAPGATRPWTHCLLSYVLNHMKTISRRRNRLEVKHSILMEIMLSHTPARLTTSPGFKNTSKPYGDPKKPYPLTLGPHPGHVISRNQPYIYIYIWSDPEIKKLKKIYNPYHIPKLSDCHAGFV